MEYLDTTEAPPIGSELYDDNTSYTVVGYSTKDGELHVICSSEAGGLIQIPVKDIEEPE